VLVTILILEPGVELTGILVPRKQEHPLNNAVGFSVQWDTNVGVEAVEVVVVATGTVRLNWTFSSREATVVVAVTVAVLCRTRVNTALQVLYVRVINLM
jgi:hypothetical protein